MFRSLYTLAIRAAAPVALTATALRGLREPSYRDRLAERLGYTRVRFAKPPLWIHAVSVGEVQAAASLVRQLHQRYPQLPLLVTTATPTGAQRAAALFEGIAQHAYLPYDTPGAVRRFLDRVQPQLAVIMEREVWPNLFERCAQRGIPVVIASARISARSAQRQQKLRALFAPALARNVTIAAQTQADADGYASIGAPRAAIHVVGNVKFDLDVSGDLLARGAELRARWAARPVWVAGSTHDGEEAQVLAAHELIRGEHADALLVLAPRHPQRFGAVTNELRKRQIRFVSRSSGAQIEANTSVVLADTLGELVTLYAAADVTFVGGSLVPIGGHNLLEPAALGKPVLTGPHYFNSPDVAALMIEHGAVLQVSDAQQLAQRVSALFHDENARAALGSRACAIVGENRGALERILQLIEPLLSGDQQRTS